MKEKVIALLKQGWTQHVMARDSDGNETNPISNKAVCWCLLGAIYKVGGHTSEAIHYKVTNIAAWNDNPNRTVEEVIDLVEKTL